MKFSLLFELQISNPTPEKEQRAIQQAVEQAVLADSLGYWCVWAVEHHGLYEYSHSSAPEVLLAYIAAKTKSIRIGHGVTLTPGYYNHPLRIAERIAMLDQLSGGRVNWGSGKSSSLTEQGAFNVDTDQLHSQWLEALELIPAAWRDDILEWQGQHWRIPPTRIIPKPLQTPHPPVFAACTKPDSVMTLAELGVGALNFAIGTDDYLAKKVQLYRDTVSRAQPQHYSVNNHFAVTPISICLPDDREACHYGFQATRFFWEALSAYYFSGERLTDGLTLNRDPLTDDELQLAMERRLEPDNNSLQVVGDAEHCKAMIQRYATIGVDEVILVMQAGTVPHEIVMQSIETFGREVIPEFSDNVK